MRKPCAIVVPKGPALAFSGSTWMELVIDRDVGELVDPLLVDLEPLADAFLSTLARLEEPAGLSAFVPAAGWVAHRGGASSAWTGRSSRFPAAWRRFCL